MVEILPGILEKEWNEIERKIHIVKPFAKSIHVDIIDGKFAPNAAFLDPAPFKKYSGDLFLELHMMVEDPIQYLESFAKAGFKRFLGHIEKMPDQAEFVAAAQLLGEVGLAVDGPTPLDSIKVPYEDLDCVLVMTIKSGWSGQEFNPEYLKKIEIVRGVYPELNRRSQNGPSAGSGLVIEVDGGIDDKTIPLAKNAGATRFVSNSFLFKGQNPQEQYNLLKKCLKNQ